MGTQHEQARPQLFPGRTLPRWRDVKKSRSSVRLGTMPCAMSARFDRNEILAKAAEDDLGFDLGVFAQTLRTHARIDDIDFPDVGVSIPGVRAYFDTWADELDGRELGYV